MYPFDIIEAAWAAILNFLRSPPILDRNVEATCEYCDGSGKVLNEYNADNTNEEDRQLVCGNCDGTGTVYYQSLFPTVVAVLLLFVILIVLGWFCCSSMSWPR